MKRSASKKWSITSDESMENRFKKSNSDLHSLVNQNGSNGSMLQSQSMVKQSKNGIDQQHAKDGKDGKDANDAKDSKDAKDTEGAEGGEVSKRRGGSGISYSPPNRRGPAPTVSYITERAKFILLGDSLTQHAFTRGGWGQLMGDLYVRRADVLNRGYSGYNTRWALQLLPYIFTEDKVPGYENVIYVFTVYYITFTVADW
jgi:hypothetical protein